MMSMSISLSIGESLFSSAAKFQAPQELEHEKFFMEFVQAVPIKLRATLMPLIRGIALANFGKPFQQALPSLPPKRRDSARRYETRRPWPHRF